MSYTARADCKCGGSISVRCNPTDKAPGLIKSFWSVHVGDGHEPCTPAEAARARRRAEAQVPS